MKILLVGQARLSPARLQQFPLAFDDLVEHLLDDQLARPRPKVLEVDESYRVPYAMAAYRADQNGMAELWKARFES